jgi:preprotein translocase subunit SecF
MEIIRPGTNFDFLGKRTLFFGVSAGLILLGLVSLVMRGGPRYGIDFAGGTLIQVRFAQAVPTGEIREALNGVVEGTPVVALCGKVWVPSRDPDRYPVCKTCAEIRERLLARGSN